jgi:hypothetical protein
VPILDQTKNLLTPARKVDYEALLPWNKQLSCAEGFNQRITENQLSRQYDFLNNDLKDLHHQDKIHNQDV